MHHSSCLGPNYAWQSDLGTAVCCVQSRQGDAGVLMRTAAKAMVRALAFCPRSAYTLQSSLAQLCFGRGCHAMACALAGEQADCRRSNRQAGTGRTCTIQSQHRAKRAHAGEQDTERATSLHAYYAEGSRYGLPASVVLFELAYQLHLGNNYLLWCARTPVCPRSRSSMPLQSSTHQALKQVASTAVSKCLACSTHATPARLRHLTDATSHSWHQP